MKKLISLLLVIVITCSLLSGCGFEIGKTEQSTTTSTTVTTTDLGDDPIQNPPVEELVFEHGDNFTEKDIELVRSMHAYIDAIFEPYMYSFSKYVDKVKEKKCNAYFVRVDKNNPIYICGYMDLDDTQTVYEFGARYINIEGYVWHKYTDKESIPKEIDNLILAWCIRFYDAVITYDIGRGIECEREVMFFSVGIPKYDALYDYTFLFTHWLSVDDIPYYVMEPFHEHCFKGHTTSDGKSYFVLKYNKVLDEDGNVWDYLEDNRKQLEECYDILSPHFERVEELDYETVDLLGNPAIFLLHGIPIDIMTEVLFK